MLNIPGLKRVRLPLNGGLDEISPADALAPEDAVKMENFRLSKDGKRVEKRLGTSLEYEDFGRPVYGYDTYFDSAGTHCQIAVLDNAIMTKVGDHDWTLRYGFPSNLTHTVKVHEVQGKKMVITEVGSKMIHFDGNCYQIGIDAPTTVPTPTAEQVDVGSQAISDTFVDYADTAELESVGEWIDEDAGYGAATTLHTSLVGTKDGPDSDTTYVRFTIDTYGASSVAQRRHDINFPFGEKFALKIPVYLNSIGEAAGSANGNAFHVRVYTGEFRFWIRISSYGVAIIDANGTARKVTDYAPTGDWYTYSFYVDASYPTRATVECFRSLPVGMTGSTELGTVSDIYSPYTDANARLELALYRSLDTMTEDPDVYVDSVELYRTAESDNVLAGTHAYAVTFIRGGDYGCESRAVKSETSSVTFSGSGLNDMTVTGEYANTEAMQVMVEIVAEGSGVADTIKVTYTGSVVSSAEMAISETTYLSYGLTLEWGATTGHTLGNYWFFTCDVCAANPLLQEVTLTNIPVSADTQVTGRKIYRTTAGGATFYYLATLNDNVSTTFTDNIPDSAMGELLEEDHYVCPDGKLSCYWDDRLWVFDHEGGIGYYSRISEPEHFDTASGWVTIRRGTPGDDITGVIPYKGALYVFKRNAIFAIQKNAVLYGVFQMNSDVGCVSPGSLIEVNDYLMFRSHRGIEVYDGANVYHADFSVPVHNTLASSNYAYADLVSAAHDKEYNEVWFSFPDLSKTVVWNYLRNKWYLFSFSQTPSCLSMCRNSTKKSVLKMGSTAGKLYLCDYGYTDGGYAISASYRKGWLDIEAHGALRRIDVEYELGVNMTMTMNVYVDMDKDVFRTFALTGSSPVVTDREFRRQIYEKAEVGGRAKYFAVEFTNAQVLAGDLKINDVHMYVRKDVQKNRKYAD